MAFEFDAPPQAHVLHKCIEFSYNGVYISNKTILVQIDIYQITVFLLGSYSLV